MLQLSYELRPVLSWLLVYRGDLQIGNKIRIKNSPLANIYNNSFFRTAGAQYMALRAACSIYERKWRHKNRRHYDSDVIHMNATTYLHIHTHNMTIGRVLPHYNYRNWLEAECGPSLYIIFTFGFVSRYHLILCRQMSNMFTLYWLGKLPIHILSTNW